MDKSLLDLIDAALEEVLPMVALSFEPAVSIERKLNWCRRFEAGLASEPRPGAFSMGLIAVREFDLYGDRPGLSALINEVQRRVEAAPHRGVLFRREGQPAQRALSAEYGIA